MAVPVVTFERADLCRLMGQDVPMDRLAERMPMIGGDLDKVEDDRITIEWFPDRPDLLTPEGTARAVAAFLGLRTGLPAHEVHRATTRLVVDDAVRAVRPYAALCFVRGVPFDEALLKAVVDAQEKLTLAPGRKRRKIAIGIHDASGLQGPFRYTAVGRDEHSFRPLQWDGELTPGQVLERHPKGREYGHLVGERVPLFLDGQGQVISMPPVINAARTAVTADTRDVLVDVTGTDAAAVRRTIALLAAGLADRGGTIEAIEVEDASGTWSCPDLRPSEQTLEVDTVRHWLGKDLDADEVAAALERMGHGAEAFDTTVLVRTAPWRFDLLHDIDLVEDVAIGHGYERFAGRMPASVTVGREHPHQALERRARTALLGQGWSEARTLTLSSPEEQWGHWGAPAADAVRIANAVMEDRTVLRTRIAPGLLRVLAQNRHRPLPQRLFECGQVVLPQDGGHRNRLRVAAVECAADAGLSRVKGLAEALMADLGVQAALEPVDLPGCIAGRAARILVDGVERGHFGELHPDTLVAFGLGAATTILEFDLQALEA